MRLSALILTLIMLLAAQDGNAQTATRLFGHLAYGEASPAALAPVPSLPSCALVREAADDLGHLLAAARAEGIDLAALSCFRSIAHQRQVFCAGADNCDTVAGAALRARFVGPPGHSEHATGYAVDFVQRGADCRATEQCFLLTPGGKWLMRRGPEFGFELSFPQGNKQGVGWEPWHWRWVGRGIDTRPQVQAARARFAIAHASFPALPAVTRPQAKTAAGLSPDRRSIETAGEGGGYAVSSSRAGAAILSANSAIRRP